MPKYRGSRILTAGAVTFALYVLLHPRGAVEEAVDLDEAVHSMAVESTWVLSHLVGLAAVAMIGLGVWMLLRSGWLSDQRGARRSAWLLLAGTVAAAVELVPHILVASETTELVAGAPSPLTDAHVLFQATLVPVYAVGVAALALTGFGRVAHPVACALGIVGGIALALVGPVLLITDDPKFGKLFMLGAGTFLFLLAAGTRLVRGSVPVAPALEGELVTQAVTSR
jgi:hypothetical protein